jgi:DNA polymerase V
MNYDYCYNNQMNLIVNNYSSDHLNILELSKVLIPCYTKITDRKLIPIFSSKVRAGFPSPADDHLEKRLDLTEYLINQPDATFFITIAGDSMRDAGILSGDKAIVDRSRKARVGDIVLAVVDGEFTIKLLGKTKQGTAKLIPANPDYPIIEIKEEMQFEVWGVVVGTFRKY